MLGRKRRFSIMQEYAKAKKEYEKYKNLKKKIGLKDSRLIDIKQMEANLKKILSLIKWKKEKK